MPSPFPGMDPFLEFQEWEDFHATFNTVIRELLRRALNRVTWCAWNVGCTWNLPATAPPPFRRSDVSVLWTGKSPGNRAGACRLRPEFELPMPEERRETYLVVRLRESMEVVTVLECPSPGNKRAGGDGRREYLDKREAVLQSQAHIVELDLLRGGARLPTVTPLPPADYYAIVSRRQRRPAAAVYFWTIRDRLPTLPVPLKTGDPDVPLDLQAAFSTVYDRARYDLSLNYDFDLQPPPRGDDAAWVQALLRVANRSVRSHDEIEEWFPAP